MAISSDSESEDAEHTIEASSRTEKISALFSKADKLLTELKVHV